MRKEIDIEIGNFVDQDYQNLLRDILKNGVIKKDRTGVGTKSVFGRELRFNMQKGFPLLTTKKMYVKGIVAELIWFLRGDTDIRFLWKNNTHIWDNDWYRKYSNSCSSPYSLEEMFAKVDDPSMAKDVWDCGRIYGAQWKKWSHRSEKERKDIGPSINNPIDQIAELIQTLKTNPDSRRMMVTAWNPAEIDGMALPPCHYGFQVWTRELTLKERFDYWFHNHKPNRDVVEYVEEGEVENQMKYFDEANIPQRAISLRWNQRSVDTFLGLPFNIASYAILLELIAKEVNMIPEELSCNLGDTHIYLNHFEAVEEQLNRDPLNLPNLIIDKDASILKPEELKVSQFNILNYTSHDKIKAKLNE